jgi:hypothetical protein
MRHRMQLLLLTTEGDNKFYKAPKDVEEEI